MTQFIDGLSVKKELNKVSVKVYDTHSYCRECTLIYTFELYHIKERGGVLLKIETLLKAMKGLGSHTISIEVHFNIDTPSAWFWFLVEIRDGLLFVGQNNHAVADMIYFAEEEVIYTKQEDDYCKNDYRDDRSQYEYAYGEN